MHNTKRSHTQTHTPHTHTCITLNAHTHTNTHTTHTLAYSVLNSRSKPKFKRSIYYTLNPLFSVRAHRVCVCVCGNADLPQSYIHLQATRRPVFLDPRQPHFSSTDPHPRRRPAWVRRPPRQGSRAVVASGEMPLRDRYVARDDGPSRAPSGRGCARGGLEAPPAKSVGRLLRPEAEVHHGRRAEDEN